MKSWISAVILRSILLYSLVTTLYIMGLVDLAFALGDEIQCPFPIYIWAANSFRGMLMTQVPFIVRYHFHLRTRRPLTPEDLMRRRHVPPPPKLYTEYVELSCKKSILQLVLPTYPLSISSIVDISGLNL
ncbi:hypothetical protein BDP27DRAFT_1335389 [Rhodocollybia butyracea]|uniref:Uncharacterized protein n=1 Tax=Rhodocollybia butyracea TaxID=206335 RepID=A0A9P5PJL6_9AGAR|nr:hypothetical protein BDP27DRAFT_1335389 [Rhodocollybia butyracea]